MKEYLRQNWWIFGVLAASLVLEVIAKRANIEAVSFSPTLACVMWFVGLPSLVRFGFLEKPIDPFFAGLSAFLLWVPYSSFMSTLTEGQYKPSMVVVWGVIASYKALKFPNAASQGVTSSPPPTCGE